MEVNKGLSERKKEEQALARQRSREFIDQRLSEDQRCLQADKAKLASRRLAHQELARYYKSKIAEKDEERATTYRSKLGAGAGACYFPYTEGEHINQTRKAQNALMREEMRGFLKEQRDAKSARGSGDTNSNNRPESSVSVQPQDAVRTGSGMLGEKQPPYRAGPHEHMSRRAQDEHVRRALEAKVQATKDELEELTRERQLEAQAWEDGMMVNDALRYDATRSKNLERKSNAEFLRRQIEERKKKNVREKEEFRSQQTGYFGPEDKDCPDILDHVTHTTQLIKQMEVNQHRRLDSRSRRLDQERRLVDNSLAEISQDRIAEHQKLQQHREVLVTTWDSQRKIREVMNRIESQL